MQIQQANKDHPLLKRRHPEYDKLKGHWQFEIDSFVGGPEWVQRYIKQFSREGDNEYRDRLFRSFRQNIVREIIEIYTGYQFKSPIARAENRPECLDKFWAKADKEGNDIDTFMEEVSDWTKAVSPIFIGVDMPARKAEHVDKVLSKAEERAAGYAPYAYVILPTDMLDFGVDEDGRLTWAAIQEFSRDDADPLTSDGAEVRKIRLWTKTDWKLFKVVKKENNGNSEETLVLEAEGVHNLGKVPIVRAFHKKGLNPYRAISLTEDIVYKDRAIANNESQIQMIIADQSFSQLFMPHSAIGGNAKSERGREGRKAQVVETGTKRIVGFNDDANHVPFFAAPDASTLAALLTVIAQMRLETYQAAILGSEGSTAKKGAVTATERSYDFSKLNGALRKASKNLQKIELQIDELVCLWSGEQFPDDPELVVYPEDFDVKSLADDLSEAVMLGSITTLGGEFWFEFLNRLVDKVLPDLEPEAKTRIMNEVKESTKYMQAASIAGYEAQINPPEGDEEDENMDNANYPENKK